MKLREVSKTIEGCECEVVELENTQNTEVKGYAISLECSICRANRETLAIEQEAARLRQEQETKIKLEMERIAREQAIANLKTSGELPSDF
jgi:hypothetical protein